jgi:hypothetical protein
MNDQSILKRTEIPFRRDLGFMIHILFINGNTPIGGAEKDLLMILIHFLRSSLP